MPTPTGEPLYPTLPGLKYGSMKLPTTSMESYRAVSGREVRINNYPQPLWNFELQYEFLRDKVNATELRTLMDFYLSVYGGANTFLFDDPDDDRVTGQFIGNGSGAIDSYYLLRQLVPNGFLEIINAPNVVSALYFNGAKVDPATYSVNASTGLIKFQSPVNNGIVISADFTYFFRCRFTSDQLEFSKFMDRFWELRSVKFVSVRP